MASPHDFATTRWSLVLAAGKQADGDSRGALEALCHEYWFPIYAYVRRRVASLDDAQDLTQAFFAHLLERNAIGAADQERGRFRAFLLTSCRNFLANEWEKASAQKRGGNRTVLSLDFERGEERYQLEPVDHLTPEVLYERQWALTLLDRTLQLLRDEFIKDGKTTQFEVLKPFLGGESESTSYADVARQLHVSEGAARVIIHRLRRRYRDFLRQEIAQTVAHEEEVSDEIRGLFAALER